MWGRPCDGKWAFRGRVATGRLSSGLQRGDVALGLGGPAPGVVALLVPLVSAPPPLLVLPVPLRPVPVVLLTVQLLGTAGPLLVLLLPPQPPPSPPLVLVLPALLAIWPLATALPLPPSLLRLPPPVPASQPLAVLRRLLAHIPVPTVVLVAVVFPLAPAIVPVLTTLSVPLLLLLPVLQRLPLRRPLPFLPLEALQGDTAAEDTDTTSRGAAPASGRSRGEAGGPVPHPTPSSWGRHGGPGPAPNATNSEERPSEPRALPQRSAPCSGPCGSRCVGVASQPRDPDTGLDGAGLALSRTPSQSAASSHALDDWL